jgi:soluble lytic murein transglycosylase-like protein
MICQQAAAAGVPPGIALAQALRESGINQWYPDGSVVTGQAGEIGIFQVMPSTAPGVDLTDPEKNINAGVNYLAEQYQKYGDWTLALSAYNWGPGKVDRQLAAGQGFSSFPSSVRGYATQILAAAATMQCMAIASAVRNPVTPVLDESTGDLQTFATAPAAAAGPSGLALAIMGGVMLGVSFLFD